MAESLHTDFDQQFDQICQYFAPSTMSFWKWSSDQQTIVWSRGETIAFRSELANLLNSLSPVGLPPLDTVLLVIAACRASAKTTLPDLPVQWNFAQFSMGYSLVSQVENLRDQLYRISDLPDDLRSTTDGKQAILTLIAENGPRLSSFVFVKGCIEWLRQGYSNDSAPGQIRQARSTGEWSVFLRGLQDGLASVNEAAVRLRLRTGLEPVDIPHPIPLELPEPEPVTVSVWEMLRELEQDQEHAGLFRLVKRLLSVVTLPRPLSAPADQPQGGVSDITNRGPFDRLLLSELAHDVDVLMTRVALNEALYIRREIPPTIPPRNRLVLLDAGIRMWGLPRLYSAAVSLALAATQHDSVTTRIFRAENQTVVPVELNSREAYLEHLEVLELPAHPGRALPAFLEEAQGAPTDYVIVTGEDVLADLDFRLCLSEQKVPEWYLIAVNRQGALRLIHRTRQGERILKQVRLDLEQILQTPPPSKVKLRDPIRNPDLPAIFHVAPFPLLLCHKIEWNDTGDVAFSDRPPGMVAITSDRRLMYWASKQQWARQLCDRLPPGSLLWHSASPVDSGSVSVIVGSLEAGKLHYVIARSDGSGISVCQLPVISQRIKGVCVYAGIIHVILADKTQLYSAKNGTLLDTAVHVSGFEWIRDRFYKGAAGCYVRAFDGQSGVWQLVLGRDQIDPVTIKSLFDSQQFTAPVAVTKWNRFVVTGALEELVFQSCYASALGVKSPEKEIGIQTPGFSNYYLPWISQDGNQVKLVDPTVKSGPQKVWIVDLVHLTATEAVENKKMFTSNTNFRIAHSGNLRSRFEMVGVYSGMLVLMTRRQTFVTLSFDPWAKRISIVPLNVNRADLGKLVGFKSVPLEEGVGYDLKVSIWDDGSRIYLDSRGLLHLRSSDESIPEMTLVLHDKQVCGWTNQNQVWGELACIGEDQNQVSPEKVFRGFLISFCARLR